jgi:hypothetical protein
VADACANRGYGGRQMHNFVLHRRRWVGRAFGRNPLLRRPDRVEASVILAAFLLALAVFPFCVAQGVDVYRARAQLYAAQSHARHMVTASVAATGDPLQHPHSTTSAVLAVWSVGAVGARGDVHQIRHAQWVTTDRRVTDGDQIRVWVDEAGAPVSPPTPPTQAEFDAIGVGAGIWGVAIVGLAVGVAVLRVPVNRIRRVQLDREIERFVTGGTTNHPQ